MKKRDLKKALITISLLLLTVGCGASKSSSITTNTQNAVTPNISVSDTHGEATLTKSWARAPIPFYISNTVPDRLVQPILDSFLDWESAAGKTLFSYQGRIDSSAPGVDGKNVVYLNPERNADGLLGVTTTRVRNNHEIIEGDITFFGNPDNYEALNCDEGTTSCHVRAGKFDITTVALHEIGHLLGFDHTDETGAIMNPDFGMNDVVHNLDEDLIAQILEAYPSQVASR